MPLRKQLGASLREFHEGIVPEPPRPALSTAKGESAPYSDRWRRPANEGMQIVAAAAPRQS